MYGAQMQSVVCMVSHLVYWIRGLERFFLDLAGPSCKLIQTSSFSAAVAVWIQHCDQAT